ncbi:hypothetical protein LCGC14_2294140 [marine sediment metagenome]|uniref:Uncharacterized protein n=1 Tax=marine sediment metagenome TaxID=412755 RepID=A0A0F9CQV0_9ZZZZ
MAQFQQFKVRSGGGEIIINLDQVVYFMREKASPNGDPNDSGSIAGFAGGEIRYRLEDTLEEINAQLLKGK